MAKKKSGGLGPLIVIICLGWLAAKLVGTDHEKPTAPNETSVTVLEPSSTIPAQNAEQISEAKPLQSVADVARSFVWVSGDKVAFRNGPGKDFAIINRISSGRRLELIEGGSEWSKAQDTLSRREGWIASRFLTDKEPKAKQQKREDEAPTKPKTINKPTVPDSVIVAKIIAESIFFYSGNCPCPFNRDRAGRRCGKHSAYSRPGGESPICFASDVSRDMISAFRSRGN